jgi:hypothetical protein
MRNSPNFCVSELPFKPILQVLSLADSLGIAELKACAVSFTCAHFQELFPTGESLGAALASRSRLLQELLASNQLILRRRNGVILAGRDLEVSWTGSCVLRCRIRIRHTYMIGTCRDESSPPCLSGIQVCTVCLRGFSLVQCAFCPICFISPSDALTLSSSSLSVFFCRRPRLKTSLPCDILTDSAS